MYVASEDRVKIGKTFDSFSTGTATWMVVPRDIAS